MHVDSEPDIREGTGSLHCEPGCHESEAFPWKRRFHADLGTGQITWKT